MKSTETEKYIYARAAVLIFTVFISILLTVIGATMIMDGKSDDKSPGSTSSEDDSELELYHIYENDPTVIYMKDSSYVIVEFEAPESGSYSFLINDGSVLSVKSGSAEYSFFDEDGVGTYDNCYSLWMSEGRAYRFKVQLSASSAVICIEPD